MIQSTNNDSIKVDFLFQLDDLVYMSNSEWDRKINKEIVSICLKKRNRNKKYFIEQYAYALNNLSLNAVEKSEMQQALEYLLQAYKISKAQKLKDLESNVLNNIGLVYRNIGSNRKALEYYLRSAAIINDSLKDANTFNNIGLCYSDMNDEVNAFKFFYKSLRISRITKNEINEANVLCNIADIQFKKGDFKEAKENYLLGNQIFSKLKNNQGFSYSSNKIALCLKQENDINNSILWSLKSNRVAQENELLENEKESSLNLYKCYKILNNKELTIYYLEKYLKLYKESQNRIANNNLVKKQFELEFEQKKIRADLNYKKKIELSKEKEQQQKLLFYFSIAILVLVVCGFFIIYKRYKITRSQNLIIENQKEIVEHKNREILDSITYAKRIQSAILPQPRLVKEYFKDSFILYKPKDIVAGDFYWFEVIDDLIFFAAADCTGHGVPGAMVSVVCHNALNRSVKEFSLKKPAEILNKTREIVIAEFEKSDEDVKDGMDISLCAINLETNILQWSGAHNPLWILRKDTSRTQVTENDFESVESHKVIAEIIETKADKQPIGKFAFAKDFTQHQFQLQKDDEIYIFTDGFQDQFGGAKGKKYKVSRLRELLIALNLQTMEEKRTKIDEAFENWKGDLDQVDDVCVIGVRV